MEKLEKLYLLDGYKERSLFVYMKLRINRIYLEYIFIEICVVTPC